MSDLTCGNHRAYVYNRGGAKRIAELTPLTMCRWHRIRDDISHAEVIIPTRDCCEVLGDLRTILNELHIYRSGKPVWEGPITRIEYEFDHVSLFAEDVLWQAKRTAINPGFKHVYPNTGYPLDTVDVLLHQCYLRQDDPWNMLPRSGYGESSHLHPIRTPDEPKHYRTVYNWQDTVWNQLDHFAEDSGIDYTVVNRDVYYWDVHWEWKRLSPLKEEWISDYPRIVEYGNELATRCVVTNGRGWAGIDQAGADVTGRDKYGYVDLLITNSNDTDTATKPSLAELTEWQKDALHNLKGKYPSPVGIVVPANTTLLPDAPWRVEDLIPGAWFKVTVTRLCRKVTDWQRLQSVTVEETAPGGEKVTFSSVSAPAEHHVVPL